MGASLIGLGTVAVLGVIARSRAPAALTVLVRFPLVFGTRSRLERGGLIQPLPADERRIPYRLTEAGARHLGAELSGLRRVAAAGLRRLEAP